MLKKSGVGRFPDNPGTHYPLAFVNDIMFTELSTGKKVDVFPGGYLEQDPTLDADIALARIMYEWAEKDVEKVSTWRVPWRGQDNK